MPLKRYKFNTPLEEKAKARQVCIESSMCKSIRPTLDSNKEITQTIKPFEKHLYIL